MDAVTEITKRQLEILRHSLGTDGTREPYREHFCTGKGSLDYDSCMKLVECGMMTRRDGSTLPFGGDDMFYVTQAGIQHVMRNAPPHPKLTRSEVKERPIIFSGEMVRAILDGRKTQTRRIVKFSPLVPGLNLGFTGLVPERRGDLWVLQSRDGSGAWNDRTKAIRCPYGVPGSRLWVQETWQGGWHPHDTGNFHLFYANDGSERFATAPDAYVLPKVGQKPKNLITPLFMPRWASRILLEITDVRVQRVQEISAEDALAEGIKHSTLNDPRVEFQWLWDSIHGSGAWERNEWVWAISFRPLEVKRG